MPLIGFLALALSFFVSLYAAFAGLLAARPSTQRYLRHAEVALLSVALLATLASAILLVLLITRNFQVTYVHQYTSSHLPLLYTISAFWAGQEGSLLLWFWLLALLSWWVTRAKDIPASMRPYVFAILAASQAFFALTLMATSDPFATYATRPLEGVGMLPLLENPGMVVHPPVLFLGYAGYTIPFAFALAALVSGTTDGTWLRPARRWNLLAWLALSCGILIGAWWSYVEMGWGGYWAWDPVENGSLIPWLLGTAFLHSSLIEERRRMQRGWNVVLAALTFATCLFATLITRGGIIVSELHGFASSIQPIAYFLLAAIGAVLASTLVLTYLRRAQLSSDHEVQSLLSRESSFLLLNLFFCGAAISVFLGTTFPTLSQALRGATISIQTSFYNRAVGPLLGVILALMGVCPAVGWQHASAKDLRKLVAPAAGALGLTLVAFLLGMRQPFPLASAAICSFVFFSILAVVVRDWASRRRATGEVSPSIGRGEPPVKAFLGLVRKSQRRYGAYLVHLAIVLIAAGITGSTAYKQETLVSMTEGQATSLGGYTIQLEGLNMETVNAEPVTYQSKIRLSTILGIYRGSAKVDTLIAEKNLHWALENPWVTEVAIHSTLKEDLYIILAELDQSGVASFQIVINPLVSWIWIGGALLLVGTGIAAWPQKRQAPEGA